MAGMIRRAAPLALLVSLIVAGASASAAERSVHIGSFNRIRVQGPFDVRVVAGPPGAVLAGDQAVIENIDLHVDGTTLTIRNGIGRWGERPRASTAQPVVVTLSTRNLVSAAMIGAGRLAIPRMKGDRIDLTVTGAGTISARGIDTDQANATIIGGGGIVMAGRAGATRLLANGPASIDAQALAAGDAVIRLDGPGEIKAAARFSATVDNVGLGQVTITGQPKCVVRANAGGPVVCGAGF